MDYNNIKTMMEKWAQNIKNNMAIHYRGFKSTHLDGNQANDMDK